MANLMIIPQEDALKLLFSRSTGMFPIPTLLIFLMLYFVIVTLTAGITVAAGLFVPMMLVGATFGRIMGQTMQILFGDYVSNPSIDASIYALVGAAAMMR